MSDAFHRNGSAGRIAWSATLRAPFAALGVRTDGRAVTGVSYLPRAEDEITPRDAIAERALRELQAYLRDPEFRFTVPLDAGGTEFQRRVWDAIRAIPRGESRTYGEIARTVRSGPRPVGQACGANRIALIIPCHRVIGSHGVLGGFMNAADAQGPREIKRWLLMHEGYRFGMF